MNFCIIYLLFIIPCLVGLIILILQYHNHFIILVGIMFASCFFIGFSGIYNFQDSKKRFLLSILNSLQYKSIKKVI